MWRRLVIGFNNRTKRLAISLFRQFNPGPIANGGKEINSIAYQLFRNRSCMLSSRQRYNQRDIDNLFIQGRFLIPMMRADTIAMITRKNDNCILPKSVVINRINNLAYFLINLFHKAVIYIPVSSPVFNGIIYGRVYIEITSFLKLYDSRIVWVFCKIDRHTRTIPKIRLINIPIRQVLLTGIFTDIVRIVKRSHQEKGPLMLL